MTEYTKLGRSTASASYLGNPYAIDTSFQVVGGMYGVGNSPYETPGGSVTGVAAGYGAIDTPKTYRQEVEQSRFFYRYDPLAAVVINRMVDMAQAKVKNRRGECTNEEIAYYNGVASIINPFIGAIMLEYLVTGMAIPDYGVGKIMGTRLNNLLGRKRYSIPDPFWLRNSDNIVLKRMPVGVSRAIFLYIPPDERNFILNKGIRPDGTADKELYDVLVKRFPDYVKMVQEGKTMVELDCDDPILRKVSPNADYPQPYLVPSLAALKHKWRIKQMDYSIATRAIESIRHVRVGNDMFPVVEGDPGIDEVKQQMTTGRPGARPEHHGNEGMYTLYTNHTVDIEWVYPPLEALLSDAKYSEPNSDILLGMGFSRVLLVGESLRSNSGGDAQTMGPVSTLTEMRSGVLHWIKKLYQFMAEENGFRNVADPFFPSIPTAEMSKLVQFAISAVKLGKMSSDYMLQMFGSDFESEHQQLNAEEKAGVNDPVPEAAPVPVGPALDILQQHSDQVQTQEKQLETESSKSKRLSSSPASSTHEKNPVAA